MKYIVEDPGHTYTFNSDVDPVWCNTIHFIKRENGKLVHDGIQNEDLIDVLLNRLNFLQEKFPCAENYITIMFLQHAKQSENDRTSRRTAQNVEGTDLPHNSLIL